MIRAMNEPMTALLPVRARRRFLLAGASLALGALRVGAQPARVPLADMHSHYGMFSRTLRGDLRADSPYLRESAQGIQQVREPVPGDLWTYFQRRIADCDARLKAWGLAKALTPADVEARGGTGPTWRARFHPSRHAASSPTAAWWACGPCACGPKAMRCATRRRMPTRSAAWWTCSGRAAWRSARTWAARAPLSPA